MSGDGNKGLLVLGLPGSTNVPKTRAEYRIHWEGIEGAPIVQPSHNITTYWVATIT